MTAPTIKRNTAKLPLISGRRPDMSMPCEVLDCFAFDQKPRERCVSMTTKSARADVTGSPRVEELALPKYVENGNLSVTTPVIRWMSVEPIMI
jgi:hypothetical protein